MQFFRTIVSTYRASRRIRAASLTAAAATTAMSLGACAAAAEPPPPPRGTLTSLTPVAQLDTAGVAAQLRGFGLDTSHVTSGVQAARIEYATVDPDGEPTTASGLVALPDHPTDGPLPIVSWQHGTVGSRGETASVSSDNVDRAAALMFASAGHVVSAPDYLGLGTGPGPHPYDHTASAVTASFDALRAARTVPALDGHQVDARVLLTGFSQGGPVSMALGHAMQDEADPGFVVGGLAPIDGPYSFSSTLAAAASGSVPNATAYLGYLTVAWNRLHGLYDNPSEAFRAPYDATVEDLLSGERPTEEIMAGLPPALPELFTPEFLQRLRHPDGELREALEQEDTSCDWAPSVPVQLYHATGDRDVPFDNSELCRSALTGRGATAQIHDTGNVDHSTAAVLALPQILESSRRSRVPQLMG